MAFKKAQKITLSDLDRVSKEYESLLKTTEKTYADWDLKKDEAFETISTVEEIASSISHTPFTINRKLKKLHIQKADYKDKETIEREKRKEDLITGSGVVAVLGAGAAAAVSFWDYVVDFVSKRTGGKIGKNNGLNCTYENLHVLSEDMNKAKAFSIDKKSAALEASGPATIPALVTDVYYSHEMKYFQLQVFFNKNLVFNASTKRIVERVLFQYCDFDSLFIDWLY